MSSSCEHRAAAKVSRASAKILPTSKQKTKPRQSTLHNAVGWAMRKRRCSICARWSSSKASAARLYRRLNLRRSFLDRFDSATPKDLTLAISGGLATDAPDFVLLKDGARRYSSTLLPLCVRVGRRRRPSASFSGTSSMRVWFWLQLLVSANGWISWRWARNRWSFTARAYGCAPLLASKLSNCTVASRRGCSACTTSSTQSLSGIQRCCGPLPY